MRYLIAFLAMCALDFVWADYVAAVSRRAPVLASSLAVGITALAGLTTILYVGDHLTLAAGCAGAFCGTWLSVERHRRHH